MLIVIYAFFFWEWSHRCRSSYEQPFSEGPQLFFEWSKSFAEMFTVGHQRQLMIYWGPLWLWVVAMSSVKEPRNFIGWQFTLFVSFSGFLIQIWTAIVIVFFWCRMKYLNSEAKMNGNKVAIRLQDLSAYVKSQGSVFRDRNIQIAYGKRNKQFFASPP